MYLSRNMTFRWKATEVSNAAVFQSDSSKTRSRPTQVLNSLMALLIWKAPTFWYKLMFKTWGKPAGEDMMEKELKNRRQFIKFNHQRVRTRNFYRISQVTLSYILLNNEKKSLSCFVIISLQLVVGCCFINEEVKDGAEKDFCSGVFLWKHLKDAVLRNKNRLD